MSESGESVPSLTVAFVGDQEVSKENAEANIGDLVSAHRRTFRASNIRFIISVDHFTETLKRMATYALDNSYALELVGRPESFEAANIGLFEGEAGAVFHEEPDGFLSTAVMRRLVDSSGEKRLILLADASQDDEAYRALFHADERGIVTRTLLVGMDRVVLKDINKEKEQTEVPVNRVEDDDDLEEDEDVEEEEEEEEPEDDEDEGPDDDDLSEDEEEEDEPEDLEEEEEPEEEEEEDPEEGSDEEDDEDEGGDDGLEEEEEEPVPTRTTSRRAAAVDSDQQPLTEKRLLRMAERDRDGLYAIAEQYGIYPGRGIRTSTMVTRILEASTGKAPKKAAAPAKRSARRTEAPARPAKRVASKGAAPARRASGRQRRTETAKAVPKAVARVSGGADTKKVLRTLGQALIEAAKAL